jgi:hypothetical protein
LSADEDCVQARGIVYSALVEERGSCHPDVAASIGRLATLDSRQGRYADAEPTYKRSPGIKEKAFDPKQCRTVRSDDVPRSNSRVIGDLLTSLLNSFDFAAFGLQLDSHVDAGRANFALESS